MPMQRHLVITIDGPAGAGKTTVSRRLAQRLRYRYVDTGALYRAVALAVRRAGVEPGDDGALEGLCRGLDVRFVEREGRTRLMLSGEDVTDRIRTPEISMLASAVSARASVRRFLLVLQRRMGREKRAVFEGRDMGTVVFPEADVKFYLDADPSVRARRRFEELAPGTEITLDRVEADIRKRDADDMGRNLAPLVPAPDAIRIDSSGLDVDDVVESMLAAIDRSTGSGGGR